MHCFSSLAPPSPRPAVPFALVALLALAGCAPASPSHDAGPPDAPSRDAADPCATCGREVRCPSGLSLPCPGGLLCRDNAVHRRIAAPYHACDQAQLDALARANACDRYTTRLAGCRDGCAPAPVPSRYGACDLRSADPARASRYARLLCADALAMPFTPCNDDADCHPVADVADLDLTCRGGRCQPIARRAPEPGFNAPCGLSSPPATDGVVTGPRCDVCVVRTRGCFAQRCSQRCQLDEDCPAGWDCAVDARCEGVCLPRGSARDRTRVELSCDDATDGGVSDAR